MLNLLSCLDFVFVFCVFNFVSCPSRHMRWKLFPDVSKDYCCSVSRVRINILKQLWCYNHSVTILLQARWRKNCIFLVFSKQKSGQVESTF